MTTALLSTTYFGPVQWYQKLARYDCVLVEHHETFAKQTYRNRCLIATTQGVQALTVPVTWDDARALPHSTGAALVSDHGNWRHQHWQALQSAYGDSPFFEFYEDDLRPFFTEARWPRLVDFNAAICHAVCQLIDLHPHLQPTTEYVKNPPQADFRLAINPKHPLPDADFQPRRYYQVFAQRHGFLPNLSILDLLFNMGPESIFYL